MPIVTKTRNEIQETDVTFYQSFSVDIKEKLFIIGLVIDGSYDASVSAPVPLSDIVKELSADEWAAVKKFVKIGKKLAVNIHMTPDTPLVDGDVVDGL